MVNGQVAMDPAPPPPAHTVPVTQMLILHEPRNLDRAMALAMDPVMALAINRAMARAMDPVMALAVDRAMAPAVDRAMAPVMDQVMALAINRAMALAINRAMALAIDRVMGLAIMVPAVVAAVGVGHPLHTMMSIRLITFFFSESFEMAR